MMQRSALALALAFTGIAACASIARAVPVVPASAAALAAGTAQPVDLGCGRGYTRGHFGACVTLHHRHDRIHGRHSGHDYDIHDRRHYRSEPHLYHGRSHRGGAHHR